MVDNIVNHFLKGIGVSITGSCTDHLLNGTGGSIDQLLNWAGGSDR